MVVVPGGIHIPNLGREPTASPNLQEFLNLGMTALLFLRVLPTSDCLAIIWGCNGWRTPVLLNCTKWGKGGGLTGRRTITNCQPFLNPVSKEGATIKYSERSSVCAFSSVSMCQSLTVKAVMDASWQRSGLGKSPGLICGLKVFCKADELGKFLKCSS